VSYSWKRRKEARRENTNNAFLPGGRGGGKSTTGKGEFVYSSFLGKGKSRIEMRESRGKRGGEVRQSLPRKEKKNWGPRGFREIKILKERKGTHSERGRCISRPSPLREFWVSFPPKKGKKSNAQSDGLHQSSSLFFRRGGGEGRGERVKWVRG